MESRARLQAHTSLDKTELDEAPLPAHIARSFQRHAGGYHEDASHRPPVGLRTLIPRRAKHLFAASIASRFVMP